MSKPKTDTKIAALITRLHGNPQARLTATDGDRYVLSGPGAGRKIGVAGAVIRELASRGLLHAAEPGRFTVSAAAASWLKRQGDPDLGFRAQHQVLETIQLADPDNALVLVNRDESPVGALARRTGKSGEAWLSGPAVTAGERLRRDFELGGLQPRITASWSATINTGRRAGDASALENLTDMALAARLRFDRAMTAVGPEFSGILADTCCFLKGLEQVERERRWPARSAKLVLRLALQALARHYGLSDSARGSEGDGRVRHWGDSDYRPHMG